MKKLFALLLSPVLIFFFFSFAPKKKWPTILVFSKTSGYRHSSIPDGKAAIIKFGIENNFSVDTTEDAAYFNADSLKKYKAVIFLNTTGNVLTEEQQQAFENFIRSGKGFLGVHSATDTEYDWPWYVKLVGASFDNHPKPQKAKLVVADKNGLPVTHLPATWERTDEWYNFKNMNPDVTVVLKIDESSYEGGKNGSNHPMAWYHTYDGGRAFYTELGHTPESYTDPLFLRHLLGGIKYAAGMK